jgi:hypothetical protein
MYDSVYKFAWVRCSNYLLLFELGHIIKNNNWSTICKLGDNQFNSKWFDHNW